MENPKLTIELTLEQINAVLSALGDGPYRVVQPIITEIQTQATSQLQPAPSVEPVADETTTTDEPTNEPVTA